MANDTFDIQELVNESGVPRRTIYFYVQQGLLPPPNGAGLAAHYTPEHLQRLKLIPILRGQGLRLDEIRDRFAKMSPDERQRILEAASRPVAPVPSVPPKSIREIPLPGQHWNAQHFIHYTFPGGVTLSVPDPANPIEQQRIEQLLQAARRIFSGWNPPVELHHPDGSPDNDHSDPSSHSA